MARGRRKARGMDAKGRVSVKTQSVEERGEGWNSLIVCVTKGHEGSRRLEVRLQTGQDLVCSQYILEIIRSQ